MGPAPCQPTKSVEGETALMKTEHSGRGGKAPGLGLGKHRPPGASPGEAAGPRERGGVALLKHEQGIGVPCAAPEDRTKARGARTVPKLRGPSGVEGAVGPMHS